MQKQTCCEGSWLEWEPTGNQLDSIPMHPDQDKAGEIINLLSNKQTAVFYKKKKERKIAYCITCTKCIQEMALDVKHRQTGKYKVA